MSEDVPPPPATETSDEVTTYLDALKPIVGNLTFGTIVGYCSGTATKSVGKMIAFLVGISFISVQLASNFGYIKVDWKKVQVSFVEQIDATGDGKLDMEDAKVYWKKVKSTLTKSLPSAGGFSLGFLYGLK